MNEVYEIGFDEEVEASSFVRLEEGFYRFTYCGYSVGHTTSNDGGPTFKTGIAKLKVYNLFTKEEFDTEETFIMNSKLLWKISQFWLSLGAQKKKNAAGKDVVPQGWESMISFRGYMEVVKTKDKNGRTDDSGNPIYYTNKNFIAPENVEAVQKKWAQKFQQQTQPVQQQTQPKIGRAHV